MKKPPLYDLNQIIKNGYNMRIVREHYSNDNIIIDIGGSEHNINLSECVSRQINVARKSLGCPPLTANDEGLINNLQADVSMQNNFCQYRY